MDLEQERSGKKDTSEYMNEMQTTTYRFMANAIIDHKQNNMWINGN